MDKCQKKYNMYETDNILSKDCTKNQVTIDDFEKINLLGAGSCGDVYLVRHKRTKYIYAMKRLKKDTKRKNITRALTERQILTHTDYPFISTLFFCFQTELSLYIVMQYCAGGDFYYVIHGQPNNCLTEAQTKFYSSCILLALEYLHFNGIIYRDLKPENILMHESGHIVLTDFDLSFCSTDKVIPRVITKPYSHCMGVCAEPDIKCNEQVGTAEYMAPEVVIGKPYTSIVDWWSFGILFFEMLYGTTPFYGKTNCDIFKLIRKCQFEFPNHAPDGSDVSSKAKKLIKSLLIYEPEKRLGFKGGSTEIKDHPFFKDVEFQLLRSQVPPIIPELSSRMDSHYFDHNMHGNPSEDTSKMVNLDTLDDNNIWKTFSDIDHENIDPYKVYNATKCGC